MARTVDGDRASLLAAAHHRGGRSPPRVPALCSGPERCRREIACDRLSRMGFPKFGEAALGCLHRRIGAPFLLDQVKLDAAILLGSLEYLLPRDRPFAK